jgi:hypothetical protein
MTLAGVNALIQYMLTGERPRDWKDLIVGARTGKLDRNGNEQRISSPTYIKDLLSDWQDLPNLVKVLRSASHKLNPLMGLVGDLWNNSDFWGTKIYNEDDPALRQAWQGIQYVMRSAIPFSVTGQQRLHQEHSSLMQQVLPFFGFVPAKAQLSMSPAQRRAAELAQESMPKGARTADQAAHSQAVGTLMRDIKQGYPGWQSELSKGIASGQLRPEDVTRIFQSLPLNPLQYQVKYRIHDVHDAMHVWDLANPAEKQQLRAILIQKVGSSRTITPQQKQQYIRVINGYRPPQASAAPAPEAQAA